MKETLPYLAKERYERIIHEVANNYRNRGYSVVIEPQEAERPAFLQKFPIGVLAQRPDDSVVVEVKTGLTSQMLHWTKLAEVVQQHPEWRFELILGQGIEELIANAAAPLLAQDEIILRVQTAREMIKQGAVEASLLTAWSALAGALRLIARSQNFDKFTFLEQGLASGLYSEGWMDREDYDLIQDAVLSRNQVTHGFKVENLSPNNIENLCSLTERLLCEWQEEKDKKEEAD